MHKVSDATVKAMVDLYVSGKKITEVADSVGFSAGKTYYILRDAGCVFRKNGFIGKHTDEAKRKISAAHTGKVVSNETRRKVSESKKCHYNGMNGIGHTKPHVSGYVLAYVPDHPHATADGYVFEHTVVLERTIGRYLNPDEVAHHVNHVKNDNRIENLVLMNRHDHQSMHMKERYSKGGMTY